MGYAGDKNGLIERYINESENWKNHTEKTKAFILKSAQNKVKGKAVVLGSGWCLDVPLQALSEMFEELILLDIVHPAQIEHKVKKMKNVRLISADISCTAEKLYQQIRQKKYNNLDELIPANCKFGLDADFEADFYISPNVLSQVGSLMSEYLQKKRDIPAIEIKKLQQALEENHIKNLPTGKSCLIVDYHEIRIHKTSRDKFENSRILTSLPKGNFEDNWTWDFDLSGSYISNFETRFLVRALDF